MIVRPNLVPGYTIVERLGTGGLSGVFRALRDGDGLEVALKVTSLADLDPEFRPQESFEREAELLARLSHPALPRFHDWGVTLEGFGWLALELVRGVPLSHFALRPAWELIPILIPVAEALATVARAGIVHRDVAPDNVLVAAEDGRFAPKLIDFGVAKDLFASDAAGGLTQHGAFLGKLLYAPPEQLLGLPKGQTLDFRADVYSFGLMTWELFTGRPAISASTLPDVVKAHLARAWPKLVDPGRARGAGASPRRPRREDDGPPARGPALLLGGDRRRRSGRRSTRPAPSPASWPRSGPSSPPSATSPPPGGRSTTRTAATPRSRRRTLPRVEEAAVPRARGAAPLARAPLRPGRPPPRHRRVRRRPRLRPPRRRLGAGSPPAVGAPAPAAGLRARAARSGAPRQRAPPGTPPRRPRPGAASSRRSRASPGAASPAPSPFPPRSRSRPGPTAPSSPTPRAAAR